MTACYATHPWEKRDGGGMGKCCKNSFETAALGKGCPMKKIPLVPAKHVITQHHGAVSLSLSATGNIHCEKEKTVTSGAATAHDDCDGHHNRNHSNNTKKDIKDMEAAKAAVIFMGVTEPVVQLVIDMEPLEPGMAFSNAEQLYQRSLELLNNPQLQYDLFQKLYQHQPGRNNRQEECRGAGASSRAEGACQKIPTGMSEGSRQSATAASSFSSSSSSSFTAAGATGGLLLETMGAPEGTTATSSEGACKQLASNWLSPSMGKAAEATATTAPSEDVRTRKAGSQASAQQKEGNEESLTTSVGLLEDNENLPKASSNNNSADEPQPTETPSKKEQLRKKVRSLAEENWRLTQRKLCRACKQVELASSGVTFLPCGHFITCEVCSEKFDNCPACGKAIMGTVRTFLS